MAATYTSGTIVIRIAFRGTPHSGTIARLRTELYAATMNTAAVSRTVRKQSQAMTRPTTAANPASRSSDCELERSMAALTIGGPPRCTVVWQSGRCSPRLPGSHPPPA